jgi:hypothetical protein
VAGGVDDVDAELLALVKLDDAGFLARGPETAEVMVMPRSRSCSIQSVTVVPSCTSPILWIEPV